MTGRWYLFFSRYPRLTALVMSLLIHVTAFAVCFVTVVWRFVDHEAPQISFQRGVTSIELAFIPPEEETAPEPVQIVAQANSEESKEPPLETKLTPRSRGIDAPSLDVASVTAAGSTAEFQPNVIVALPPLTRVEKTIQDQVAEMKRGERQEKRVSQNAAVASQGTEQYVEAGLFTVPPIFPDEMNRRKIGGTVMLELLIEADGTISRVTIVRSSGYPLFDASAMNAAAKWRGIPARRAGMPVETLVLQEVIFKTPR